MNSSLESLQFITDQIAHKEKHGMCFISVKGRGESVADLSVKGGWFTGSSFVSRFFGRLYMKLTGSNPEKVANAIYNIWMGEILVGSCIDNHGNDKKLSLLRDNIKTLSSLEDKNISSSKTQKTYGDTANSIDKLIKGRINSRALEELEGKKDPSYIKEIYLKNPELKKDRQFNLDAIHRDILVLDHLSEELRDDSDFHLELVQSLRYDQRDDYRYLKMNRFSEKLRESRLFNLKAVRENPYLIKTSKFNLDKEVVLAAIDGHNRYTSRRDDFSLKKMFFSLPLKMQKNEEVFEAFLKKDEFFLGSFKPQNKANKHGYQKENTEPQSLEEELKTKSSLEILGITNKNPSKVEIKKAYHKMSLKFHPDKCPKPSDPSDSAEVARYEAEVARYELIFKYVNKAYHSIQES